MFGIITSLAKATVGVVVQTPLAVVADIATLGGTLTDRESTYTGEAISKVVENVEKATK